MLKSLNVAQSGLNAAKVAVENVSNNIANEHTPGYKKRVVQLSEQELIDSRFTGRGVVAEEAYRITSEYMFDNMMDENAKSNYFKEVSQILGNVEVMFQETDQSGFSSDLNRYFQSIENLRSNPNSEVYRTTFINNAKIVVNSLKNLYSNIEKQEELTKLSLESNVDKVNSIINQIGSINEQLGQHAEASNDLLDKRDQLEKELSQYVNIEVDRSDNNYQLKVGGAVAVRYNTNIREIKLVEENIAQVDKFATNPTSGAPQDAIGDKFTIDNNDKIVYKLNNQYSVSVQVGSSQYTDEKGNSYNIDFDGDGNPDTVDSTNYVRALSFAINSHARISESVISFNGNYEVDPSGKKIDNFASDDFLLVEARNSGEVGKFEGRISVIEQTGTTVTNRDNLFKTDEISTSAEDKVYLSVFEGEIEVSSGSIKAQLENLSTNASGNKLIGYKEKLDQFARAISDVYDKYVKTGTGTDDYLYGHVATDQYNGTENIRDLNLFTGSSVKTLTFNENAVHDLKQSDLDYMAKMQWKKDIGFDGLAQDGANLEANSFSEFYQNLRVSISSDKESNDFLMEAQETVEKSLQESYDKLTKVDKDEEMVNLIKFQAAYTANAKIITAVDEMLQTILNMR